MNISLALKTRDLTLQTTLISLYHSTSNKSVLLYETSTCVVQLQVGECVPLVLVFPLCILCNARIHHWPLLVTYTNLLSEIQIRELLQNWSHYVWTGIRIQLRFWVWMRCLSYLISCSRSHRPRGLRRRSTAARLLRSWVRIPPGAWMFVVSVVCGQLEVSATSWSLIQRSPTDCVVSCVIYKPQKSSWMRRRPRPSRGLSRQEKKKIM